MSSPRLLPDELLLQTSRQKPPSSQFSHSWSIGMGSRDIRDSSPTCSLGHITSFLSLILDLCKMRMVLSFRINEETGVQVVCMAAK